MRAFFASATVLLLFTGCFTDGVADSRRIGLVEIRAFDNSGTPVVRASAVFYRARGLVLTPAQPQACALFSYVPLGPVTNAGQTLNAGLNLSFTIDGFSEVATHALGATHPVYNFVAGTYLDFTSGDSALVSIPGAQGGFDAMSIKARLAEPFTADTLPTYEINTPMDVTWEPATSPGSLMIVALRYSTDPGSSIPNVEVACVFPDNGSAQIPVTFANAYGNGAPASQQHVFMRVRDAILTHDARTSMRVRSIYEYPTTLLVDAP